MSPARVARGINPLRGPDDRRLPRIAGPCSMVMFGITGDLAQKKLLPAIYDLTNRGLLPPNFTLIGFARRDWSLQEFTDVVRTAVQAGARTPFREESWQALADGLRFVSGSFDDEAGFDRLANEVAAADAERGTDGNHAFYLSIPPAAFGDVCKQLERSGLTRQDPSSWRRVIIEKPFGHDLASARALNEIVESVFPQESVFRIDHYLGKETVQNILALRFANGMFEPVWNANYVDHVQITMAEDIGIGGRAGYYDGIGAARDVIQNHLLQLLGADRHGGAESRSTPKQLRDGEGSRCSSAVRLPGRPRAPGRPAASTPKRLAGRIPKVKGYLEEDGIDREFRRPRPTPPIKLLVNTRRWAGVPFYLRTGKRLGKRVTEVAVVFKRAPHLPFADTATSELGENAIVIRVQPDEGITIRFGSKVPGAGSMEVRDVTMDFGYGSAFTQASPEAYERLILDVLLGEPPLFPRHAEVETSWRILDPIERFWARKGRPQPYDAGTWGPADADALLRRDGREWRMP